jgi:hypothetical protein
MKTKQLFACSIALFFCLTAMAQKTKVKTAATSTKKEKVQLVNPSRRSVQLLSTYFTPDITKVVLKQMSKEKLALVKKNCNEADYPQCIQDLLAYNVTDTAADDNSKKVFDGLTMYRIAKFDNIRNGENFGEESILVVPAAENKNIGGSCTFTKDFYIIIYTADIKVL